MSLRSSTTSVRQYTRQRTPNEVDFLKKDIAIDDHVVNMSTLELRYGTDSVNGLTIARAAMLLEVNGPNAIIPSPPKSNLSIIIQFYFRGFAGLLWVGSILTIIGYVIAFYKNPETPMDQLYLAIILLAVVLITGTFGYLEERKNIQILESFKKLVPKTAVVLRDGRYIDVSAEDIVVGDVVAIKAGDVVPADLRLITCNSLKVDHSAITGESEMVSRSLECTDINPLETQNLCFYGTTVGEGSGNGLVIACGDNTVIGRIADLTSALEPEEMPIKKEIRDFNYKISITAIIIGGSFFVTTLLMGIDFFEAFAYLMALIVANVPEGMLVTMTASLTLTAKAMANKNCLVKNIDAIETLGSTNVICSDKTGTLTQNRMTVGHFYYDDITIDVLGNVESVQRTNAFLLLCRVAILCNNAKFVHNQEKLPIHKRKMIGDSSECAVLKAMETYIGKTNLYKSSFPKVMEIPFNSINKYQLSIHEVPQKNIHIIVMKGAPEKILQHCTSYYFQKNTYLLSPMKRQELNQVILSLGYMGERVLGFADCELNSRSYPIGYQFNSDLIDFPLNDLRFLGLISMVDPPRVNVPEAVEKCKNAGIRVIMITGDHPITAVAIAKKVGIISENSITIYDIAMEQSVTPSMLSMSERNACTAAVITGTELRGMSQHELENVLISYEEIVFARTSPQQKLKIVEALQSLGAIVAVTGDGFNDSPALKKADIGIAMGISGSDVSKEAADIILLDDNFSSIVTGVEEGRIVFDNLKKSIAYVLTSNTPEIVPLIAFVFLGLPNTLSVISILLIDVGTDLWPAISLAYETPEADIMDRDPRDPKIDKLVTSELIAYTYLQIGIIQVCAGYTAYFITMASYGFFYDRLFHIRDDWNSEFVNNLLDSYGQEWTYEERKVLEKIGSTSFFVAIVATQIADAFIVKTRRLSVFQHGMHNWVLNFGIIFELILAAFIIYCPGVNTAFQMEPVLWISILPAIPFALLIIIYDEMRKYFIRKYPDGWIAGVTFHRRLQVKDYDKAFTDVLPNAED
ncbi:hypothetical protein FQA39_LY04114 [Lamprigera yunnana]|nr:hypothetical protein FQA39_LY04114 [Lamprigera yunnana]